jgi:LmbE family N-acetylglucosaminyl deacetylase
MTEHPLTLMAVHAHPDDEASSTGGLLARCAAEGIRTVLVTCTDGQCGDGPGGVKPGAPGHDPDAVAAVRRKELERSCSILGVDHLELLGYVDSGMMGWPTNEAPGSFWNTPVQDAAARLATLLRQYRPDVVVTYDENGFYGHPDHIQAHRITMAAADLLADSGIPAKLYWTTVPRTAMAEFADAVRAAGGDWEEPGPDDPVIGLPDADISSWIDVHKFAEQKFRALGAHASQLDNAFFLRVGLDRFRELFGVETFVRVRDTSGVALPEDDLFAGLR